MFNLRLVILAQLAICTLDYAERAAVPTATAEEKTTIEVFFATEHVPAILKAGDLVDLRSVKAKNVTGTGRVTYVTSVVTEGIEIASITPVKEPKMPEEAVKVELRVTKSQAMTIEKAKAQLVRTVERTPDGKFETRVKPLPFRLEPSKPDEK